VIYLKRAQDSKWSEVGRSEVVPDTRDPTFIKSVIIDYFFEVQQKVHIEIYNMIKPSDYNLDVQEYLGCMDCTLGEIVGSRSKALSRKIQGAKGEVHVAAEELEQAKDTCTFKMRATGLPKMDFISQSSDPYAMIYRTGQGEVESKPIYRTEVVKRSLEPKWTKVELSVQQICRGVEDRPVHFEIWDWNRTQQHSFIGECDTTYQAISRAAQDKTPLVLTLHLNPDSGGEKKSGCCAKGGGTKEVGQLILEDIVVQRKYSFLDYINGGMEVGLIVAIDFTRSNGDPRDQDSLHYSDPSQPNDYVQALRGVCEILQHYDSDDKYPVLGFGAKLPPTHSVTSHCFALNGNIVDPEVKGITDIVKVYRRALGAVSLHGPTHFKDIIRFAANIARPALKPDDDLKYYILMIICDGVINDMQETIDEIVRASETPLSIIIVGVGDEDFALMDELDADERPL
jgi:hypothetical protein